MYKEEERVLCFHGPLLYEAKILKSQIRAGGEKDSPVPNGKKGEAPPGKGPMYLVHYKGWKRTWDEWVPESRVRKWTEENLKHSKELKLEALAAQKRLADTAAQKRSSNAAAPVNGNASSGSKGETSKVTPSVPRTEAPISSAPAVNSGRLQKKTRDPDLIDRDEGVPRPRLNLQIPDTLKARLVDDWQWTTKDERLVPLPRHPTVVEILQDLRAVLPPKRPGSAAADNEDEIFNGLLGYFDKCLGTTLLYRFERQQYADIRRHYGHDARMSEIYGAEHLLRLLASMNDLVAQTRMDPPAVALLRDYLRDLLTFLAQRQGELFVPVYDVTAASYSRMLNYQ